MTDTDDRQHCSPLQRIARRAMLERGLLPDLPLRALAARNHGHRNDSAARPPMTRARVNTC